MTENLKLTYFRINKVSNGWMVRLDNEHEVRVVEWEKDIYIFPDLDQLFTWIRENTE